MKSEGRELYGFSVEDRLLVHERAGDSCEFPGEPCGENNDGRVHHLTGCHVSRLLELDPISIRDIETNALMLCEGHEQDLSRQEQEFVEVILYDRRGKAA